MVLLALHVPIAWSAVCPAIPAPLNPGDDIQAAINAAAVGAVICLNSGSYTPATTIQVNKSVTLQGVTQSGVDPRPSAMSSRVPGGADEARISGSGVLATILNITAEDVTIDGLEILNGTGDLVASPSATTVLDPIEIKNCIIHAAGDEGIQLRSTIDAKINHNYIFDTTGDGINLCCGSTYGTIADNELANIRSTDGAIYIYDLTSADVEMHHVIVGNLVRNATKNDGIKVGAKNGGDKKDKYVTVKNNTIKDMRQDGVTVYMSNVDVVDNEMYRGKSENGIVFVGYSIDSVTVTGNSIHDNGPSLSPSLPTHGVMVGKGGSYPTNVKVNNNCIVRNQRGLSYLWTTGKPLLDAKTNWWNAASGPSGCTTCTGTGDTVANNVDFSGFLIADPGCLNSSFVGTYPDSGPPTPGDEVSDAPPGFNNDDTGIDVHLDSETVGGGTRTRKH